MTKLRLFILLLCATSFVIFSKHFILLSNKKVEAQEVIRKVESILTEEFSYSEKILFFIGKKISDTNSYEDLEKIHKIFLDAAYAQGYNDTFSWSMFDWVNRKDQQTVNTLAGVNTNNPPDMSKRGYTWKGRAEFWTMQFSEPAYGRPSNVKVIPVGVGVPNKTNSYVGNVVAGINIKRLVNKIEAILHRDQRFMIINYSDYKFVFGSLNQDAISDLKDLNQYQEYVTRNNLRHDLPASGFIDEEIKTGKVRYTYARAMDQKYPYIILIGYDNESLWRQTITSSLDLIIAIILISLVVLVLFRSSNKIRFDENS
jgi:hypothetical protein